MKKRATGACALACALALALAVPAGAFAADTANTETTWAGPTTANEWTASGEDNYTLVTSTNATPSYTVTVPTAVSYDKTNGNTISATVKGAIAAGYSVKVQAVPTNSAADPSPDFTTLTLTDAASDTMTLAITGTSAVTWARNEVEQTGEVNGVSTLTGTAKTVASLAEDQKQKVGTYTGKIYYRVQYVAPSLTVSLNKSAETLAKDASATLTATLGTAPTSSSGKYTYEWASSDTTKVTVNGTNASCTVTNTSLGNGEAATVTCTATDSVDGNIVGTATCTITGGETASAS